MESTSVVAYEHAIDSPVDARRRWAKRLAIPVVAAILLSLVGIASNQTAKAANPPPTLPPGFTQTQLAAGLHNPVQIAFNPNGDIWIAEKTGAIKVFHNGAIQPNPVITLSVNSTSELGLLGLAFDPSFANNNGFIYVSYVTAQTSFSRLSRFTVVNGTATLGSEKVLLQGTQKQVQFGPGQGVKIGPDGKLWWTVGDNPPAFSNAHTLSNIYGKVIRLNLDGSVPADNPFVNIPGAVPGIYAYGLRNPFRTTFLPNGNMMSSDTGSSYWEEMNVIQPGGNYGWDFVEGNCGSCGYINPAYAYGHLPADGAISAIAAYHGTAFPSAYNNVVFFGDYLRHDIEAISFDPTYTTEVSDKVFSDSVGTIADLEQGPDGNLYFVGVYDGTFSTIRATGPFPPTAAASVTPHAGLATVNAQFSSAGSSDPYGKPLTYSWDFGDGSPADTSANPSYAYTANGTYTATLTVSNGTQSGQATTTVVVGKQPPSPSITSPAVNSKYNAGTTINFSGAATDPVDGSMPASAYTWQVDFYQNNLAVPFYLHEVPHPFVAPINGVTSGSFQIPPDLPNGAGTFYRVTLSVVNSQGITSTVTRDIQPNLTSFTVNSNVPGAAFVVDGTWQTSAYTLQDVVGVKHIFTGVPVQTIGGQRYRLVGWSDGSALTDTVFNPGAPTTYTANYEPVTGTLPAGWTSGEVGTPLTGDTDYSAATGSFYSEGAGADIFNKADEAHFTYKTLAGDGTIIARVRYQTESDPWTKAGLLIQQSTTSGSNYVAAMVTPDVSPNSPNINGINCVQPANAPGAGCDAPLPPVVPPVGHGIQVEWLQNGSKGNKGVTTNIPSYKSPNKWLKLVRAGNLFRSYYSSDGANWTLINSTTVTMTNPVLVGLFVCAHNVRQFSSVAFDNVQVQ